MAACAGYSFNWSPISSKRRSFGSPLGQNHFPRGLTTFIPVTLNTHFLYSTQWLSIFTINIPIPNNCLEQILMDSSLNLINEILQHKTKGTPQLCKMKITCSRINTSWVIRCSSPLTYNVINFLLRATLVRIGAQLFLF